MLFHEKIVFSTNNLKEIRLAISHFEVVGLKDISINEDIPETGNTLKANALQKLNIFTIKRLWRIYRF